MSYYYDYPEFDFDKEVNVDVETNIDFNAEVKLEVDKDINVDTNINTNIEGNTAIVVADVEAIGENTYTELNTSVLVVENQLSSTSLTATAATTDAYYYGY